jgi:hypothetical protein
MHKAVVLVFGIGSDALAMETGKERGRTGSVKTFFVVEDTDLQTWVLQ